MPIRKSFVMHLIPGNEVEYKKRHDELWPEMIELLNSSGVTNYSISLCEETSQLFAYAEITSEEMWNNIPNSPVCKKWWSYMKDIMKTNPDNSPVATPLRELFHLP